MFQEREPGSMQRSLDPAGAPDAYTGALLRHIGGLEEEIARLRAALRDKEELERSVTRLRDANEHLVLAAINEQSLRDEAEAANRRQNEFLAMLAHELRNPLVPISMSSMLLERSVNASPQVLNFSKVIRRQVDHMASLLDDLLDAARISSGKITIHREPLALAEVIDQAVETVLPRVRERGQQLEVHLPPEAARHARRPRAPGPGIHQPARQRLEIHRRRRHDHPARHAQTADEVVATVADNGTGIAPEVLPHIFDLFTQGPRSLARSEGGLGRRPERGAQPGVDARRDDPGREPGRRPRQPLHPAPARLRAAAGRRRRRPSRAPAPPRAGSWSSRTIPMPPTP